MRDLMGLLALPALWLGRDAATVFQLAIEALERIVALDLSYVDVQAIAEQPISQRLRVGNKPADERQVAAWSEALEALGRMPIGAAPSVQDTPAGSLHVIRLSMGYSARSGSVWFGSRHGDFPTVNQSALLRAAATLAATGLQSARIDEQRASAARAKDEFLAMLGHELRNPLSPIFTALEIIRRQTDAPLSGPHAVIERQARHLSRLVDDLLDVSRITSGKVELSKEVVSLRAVLANAIEVTGPLIEGKGHLLTIDHPAVGVHVFGDSTRLVQVFANLLTNAAKYTPDAGNISVNTRLRGAVADVAVRDDGVGIGSDLMPRLFRIFEQGASSIARSDGGLGIGLALVRNLVSLHGGTVQAFSAGVGKGSTFTVTLPITNELSPIASATLVTHRQQSDRTQRVRVLVVDDNADALATTAQFLRLSGLDVASAEGARRALELAASFDPEVALIDIGLPDANGFDLGRELARRLDNNKQLRLISLSGYGTSKDHERSKAAGFEEHLVKPVDLDHLLLLLSPDGRARE